MKNRTSGSESVNIIGLGPSIFDRSFLRMSIVLGKNISIAVTIELASYNMLLCDLKLTYYM